MLELSHQGIFPTTYLENNCCRYGGLQPRVLSYPVSLAGKDRTLQQRWTEDFKVTPPKLADEHVCPYVKALTQKAVLIRQYTTWSDIPLLLKRYKSGSRTVCDF